MFYIPLVFLVLAGVFYAGKRYGAKAESSAVALALTARSYVSNEVQSAYKAVIADIQGKEQTVLSRVKAAL